MRTCLITVALALLTGCAPHRDALTDAELQQRRDAYIQTVRAEQQDHVQAIIDRLERESGDPDGTLDILVLSSGGQYGAFGSGFLKGWGEVEGEMARPEFDVVTGVSTGALIAPFAFLGDEASYDKVYDAYRQPMGSLGRTRGVFFFLPRRSSFLDNGPLKELIADFVDESVVERIGDAYETENRILLIGTHNLDEEMMRTWSVGAQAARPDGLEHVRNILLASCAIPVVYPPVEIDGSLYCDGAVSTPLLLGVDTPTRAAARWQDRAEDFNWPRIRLWVIANERLSLPPRVAQPTWVDVGVGVVQSMGRTTTHATLRTLELLALYMNAIGADVEFRYVAVPDGIQPDSSALFDESFMLSLSDLGRQMGADPESWLTSVPAYEWPEADEP